MIDRMIISALRSLSRLVPLAVAAQFLAAPLQAQDDGKALVLDLKGPLGVATAEYLIDGIARANSDNAGLVIIRMDTPGGLVEPMRDIVQSILGSGVPVATFVTPEGARADSAGTYILLASHVAAMSPTTHLGAATPVSLTGDGPTNGDGFAPRRDSPPESPAPSESGGDPGDRAAGSDGSPDESVDAPGDTTADDAGEDNRPGSAMERKVLNDAIAYIRGLAERHGRNAEWAERAVRDAATLTAAEALAEGVIDLVVASEEDLLSAIDGREVVINDNPTTLATAELALEVIEPGWRIKFLSTIANPQVALLLMLVGVYGLLLEGYNPGAIVPGVVGVVSLLLAAYALQVLPVNYAGLALIAVGIVLIIAEAFVPSFGALGLGGIVAFIVGSIIMFDSDIPGFGISLGFVVGFSIVAGLGLLWLVTALLKLQRRGAVSGVESLVGATGTAMEDFVGEGHVWLNGEAWQAHSNIPLVKDQGVSVDRVAGLELHVSPIAAADADARSTTS